MPSHSTVLYPSDPSSTFDMAYYISKHMPLVQRTWSKHGLKEWSVVEYEFKHGAADDRTPPYSVSAILTWETTEGVKAALADEDSKTVFGDVPNFSNRAPLFMGGRFTGTSEGGGSVA